MQIGAAHVQIFLAAANKKQRSNAINQHAKTCYKMMVCCCCSVLEKRASASSFLFPDAADGHHQQGGVGQRGEDS